MRPSAILGNFLYVVGGEGPNGTSAQVFRLTLDNGVPATPTHRAGRRRPKASAGNLPAPRASAASFTNNGALYVIGGMDASGAPTSTNYWTVPNATTGDISSWSETTPRICSRRVPAPPSRRSDPTAFLIGGSDASGPVDSAERAGLSPKPPFFRLGLFGADHPGSLDQGRDRPAARLHQRDDRGHDQLRPARGRRPDVLASRADLGDRREAQSRPHPCTARGPAGDLTRHSRQPAAVVHSIEPGNSHDLSRRHHSTKSPRIGRGEVARHTGVPGSSPWAGRAAAPGEKAPETAGAHHAGAAGPPPRWKSAHAHALPIEPSSRLANPPNDGGRRAPPAPRRRVACRPVRP